MGKNTSISWTDHTFSPWWGCIKVSPGCENCYAETLSTRFGHGIWGPAKTTSRRLFGWRHWAEPFDWNKQARQEGIRRRVFCASMGDVFEDHPMLVEPRMQLWALIGSTPWLDWLVLTKRPENIGRMMPDRYWPNVWLGTSTEDQQRANERIPLLVQYRDRVPVLFLSVEPMLGPVSLARWFWPKLYMAVNGRVAIACEHGYDACPICDHDGPPPIDWVIVGGESGPKHRPFDVAWARDLRKQCKGVAAFHYKQQGGRTHAEGGCLIDGEEVKEFPRPRPRPGVLVTA